VRRRPLVSVVIPTRHRAQTLAAALASVAAQEIEDVEVVLVLDADDVQPIARPSLGPSIRRVSVPPGSGLAKARAAGVAECCGRFVAFLDDDDVWLPGHLAAALARLDGDGLDMVYTTCLVAHARYDQTRGGAVRSHYRFDYPHDLDLLSVANVIPVISAVSRVFPAEFGEPSGVVQDDWDMWLRLVHGHGWRVRHAPEATAVYHRIPRAASLTVSAATTIAGIRRFAAGHRELHRRWPVPSGGPAAQARPLPHRMYALVEQRLAAGLAVSPFYYERSLRLFAAVVKREMTPGQAQDALVEAIAADPRDERDERDEKNPGGSTMPTTGEHHAR
jgi:hypothetical protein